MATSLIRRLKTVRWKVLGVWIGGIAVATVAGVWGTAARASTPEFCASCHEMEGPTTAWKRGAHKDVACLACHASPEQAAVEGVTTAGLKQWMSYSFGSYRGRLPQGLVEDANCTACHPRADLGRTREPFLGVPFDHQTHLGIESKGLELRCTSCHTRVGDTSHVAVAEETCFTCHLRSPLQGEATAIEASPIPEGGCLTCHGERLRDDLTLAARHETVLSEGISCQRCHGSMQRGSHGEITAARCRTCHFSKGVLEDPVAMEALTAVRSRRLRVECVDNCQRCHFREGKFRVENDSTHLHGVHVGEMKVECAECHGLTGHVADGKPVESEQACDTCHVAIGAAQRGTFSESTAESATDTGFAPLHSQIRCGFCHVAPIHGMDAQFSTEKVMRPRDACRSCHADAEQGDFGRLPAKWARSHVEALAGLRSFIADAEAELEEAGSEDEAEAARALLDRASRRLKRYQGEMVGFHNLQLGRHVLKTIAADARAAVSRLGATDRVPPLVEPTAGVPADCARCHLSPAEDIQLGHRIYSHQRHREIPGVTCSTCHTDDPHPTSIALTAEQCSSCHHAPEKRVQCATCHDLEHAMYRGLWEPGSERVANVMVEKVHCAQCHFPEEGQLHPILPTKETCRGCHETDVGLLLDDWRANVRRAAARLERAIANADARGASLSPEQRRTLERARSALADVQRDRSNGVHNPTGVESALGRYASALERMAER